MVFLKKYGAYGIPVCLLLVSLLLYPRLPNELPMQFSLSGEVNRTMNKEFAIWCIQYWRLLFFCIPIARITVLQDLRLQFC